jgi:dTDP-4-dehydrorhamnose 3,5-epimerase
MDSWTLRCTGLVTFQPKRSRYQRSYAEGPPAEQRSITKIIFTETSLKGSFVIDLEKRLDQRGYFARTYCEREFDTHELNSRFVQCNISFNRVKGTLRGMHFQSPPHEEAKLIRCTRGAIYDAIVDLRPESATFKRYFSAVLSAENGKMLYVPQGFAHGFQTLEDNTEVFYQMSQFYAPEHARGVRWNDPAFGIEWPAGEQILLERDQSYPDFVD